MFEYIYLYTDLVASGGLLSQTRLQSTIMLNNSLGASFLGISRDETSFAVYFASELSLPNKAALDVIISAHTGAPFYTYMPILGTFSHAEEYAVTVDWGDITGGVADLSNFGYSVADLVAMTKCEVQTDGAGAELEMHEKGGNALMSAPYLCPNTSGDWQKIVFYTDLPISAGDKSYVCRGRKNAVTTTNIRFMTLAVSVRILQP